MAFQSKALRLVRASSQYASIADGSQVGLDITGDVELEAYIYLSSLPSVAGGLYVIAGKTNYATNQRSFHWMIDSSDNKMFFEFSNDGTFTSHVTTIKCNTAFTSTDVGKWLKVSVTVDVSVPSAVFEIADVPASSTNLASSATSIFNSTAPFSIGCYFNGGTPDALFNGIIARVRAYSAGVLVGSWDLNGDYTDASGNNNTLTSSGSPIFVPDVPFSTVNSTDWTTSKKVYIPSSKVTGSSNLTNFPVLLKDTNIPADVYSSMQTGEIYNSWLMDDTAVGAYLRFENNVTDSSSAGNNGIASNITYVTGVFGNAASFNGSNSKIVLTNEITSTTGSIFFRFKTSMSGTGTIYSQGQSSGGDTDRAHISISSGKINFLVQESSAVVLNVDTVSTFNDGSWHTCEIFVDGTSNKIFIDGVQQSVTYNVGSASTSKWFGTISSSTFTQDIGVLNISGTNYNWFNGQLDEFLIDNRPIALEEFRALHTGGADLRLTTDSAGATEVPFEIVNIAPGSSTAEVHVKLPTLYYNQNTDLYLWSGNNRATPYHKGAFFGQWNVWGENEGIYHLEDNSNDSSINQRNGTETGVTHGTGKIGDGMINNGTSGYGSNFGNVFPVTTGNATWSLYLKPNSPAISDVIFGKGIYQTDGYYFQITTGNALNFASNQSGVSQFVTTSNTLLSGTWYKIHVVKDGTTIRIYINGVEASYSTSQTITNPTISSRNFYLSRYDSTGLEFPGTTDEFRIDNIARSADWIATEYTMMNDPSTFWQSQIELAFTEVINLSDSIIRQKSSYSALTDSVLLSDSLTKNRQTLQSLTEQINFSELFGIGRGYLLDIEDDITLEDPTVERLQVIFKQYSDQVTLADTVVLNVHKMLTDTFTLGSNLAFSAGKTFLDVFYLSDRIRVLVNGVTNRWSKVASPVANWIKRNQASTNWTKQDQPDM